jgi:CubicO group peptidase (beta-lactamase class C family)
MTDLARILVNTALSVLLSSVSACASTQDKAPTAEMEAAAPKTADMLPPDTGFEDLLAAFDVPGMALATLTACKVDGVRTIGMADLEARRTVAEDTAFEAASLTKPLFAYLVLQLADEGVIDLDAPLAPFPAPRVADKTAYAQVTPRMILTHRTGMPNWVGDSQDEDRTDPIPFETAPGEAYSYSGEAFEILRAYVEAETGMSFQALFEERLGDLMPNSAVDGRLRGAAAPSRGYAAASDPATGRDLYLTPHATGAAWGLVTTAGDYAAFVSHVCRGEGLSPDLQADMLRPQAPMPPGEMPGPAAYGLGWVVLQLGAEKIVMHTGNNDEYRSLAAFLPATGEGYVILTNGRNGEDMITAIMEQAQP